MKMLILACVLGFIGTTASAHEPCFDKAFEAAATKLKQQGLEPHSYHFDSISPTNKDQHEVNFDIKLFYWLTLKNGEAIPSSDANRETKNFYVRMTNGSCRLIEEPQPSN